MPPFLTSPKIQTKIALSVIVIFLSRFILFNHAHIITKVHQLPLPTSIKTKVGALSMKDFAIDVERLSPENHTKRCYPATCCLTNDDVIIKVFPKSKKNKNNGKMKISDIIQSNNINSTGTCTGICSFVISNFETNVEAQ